jgi:hypothetical protein
MSIKKLTDAQVGQRISFMYLGGTNPGAVRHVEVVEVLGDRIVGVDLDKDALRVFMVDKAVMIEVLPDKPAVAPRKLFTKEQAREMVRTYIDSLNGPELANVLGACHDCVDATYDESGNITVQYQKPGIQHEELGFTVFNDDGEGLYICKAEDDEQLLVNDKAISDPYVLAHKLCTHLGLTIE